MKIAERLKTLRVENGYTQKQVAEILKIKQNTYSQYETGQRQLPLEALAELAIFYDVTADYFLCIVDEEYSYKR